MSFIKRGSQPGKLDGNDWHRAIMIAALTGLGAMGPALLSYANTLPGFWGGLLTVVAMTLSNLAFRRKRDNSHETWRRRNPFKR